MMELLDLLKKTHFTITTAESCTGGMVAARLVDIPGISSYFEEGYITYSDRVKTKVLGVPEETIAQYGVVSVETAIAMAEGACHVSGATCAITTTGVAGPDGGTTETPVGCVCFGCVVNGKSFSERIVFSGDRKQIREQATEYAIKLLTDKIREVSL